MLTTEEPIKTALNTEDFYNPHTCNVLNFGEYKCNQKLQEFTWYRPIKNEENKTVSFIQIKKSLPSFYKIFASKVFPIQKLTKLQPGIYYGSPTLSDDS